MRKTAIMTVIVAAGMTGCGSDDGPVGPADVRYWDIAWSSPDTILTDIEMLGEKSGWACGYRYNETTATYDGLIYRYAGDTWDVALFMPAEMGAKLMAIDFLAENDGWAVGNRASEGIETPVVLRYDGETWNEVFAEGLTSGPLKLLAAVGENDVWVSDGFDSFHFDGVWWTWFPLAPGTAVDDWVFPNEKVGWAVSYRSGYCYRWDGEFGFWLLEPYPLYDARTFYFRGDGSGVYADYASTPPVAERANIYWREAGEIPSYRRIYATGVPRRLTACDYLPPDYFFVAGPNTAFEVVEARADPLGYLPPSGLGTVRAISIAARGDIWGIMGQSLNEGPSFIVHKEG
ncbi:MAG: hypothetical protein GTN49_00075 [candidate division Zixibacteria bacterium]|nr:hypothetical protein [candidate division Zixibacteria bacterium]